MFNAYVLTRYDDIKSGLKIQHDFLQRITFSLVGTFAPEHLKYSGQGYPQVPDLVNSDGDRHKQLRTPSVKVFAPGAACSNWRLDSCYCQPFGRRFDGRAEIISQFTYPLPGSSSHIWCSALEMMADIKRWCDDTSALFSSQLTLQNARSNAHRSFVAISERLCRSNRGTTDCTSKRLPQQYIHDSGLNIDRQDLVPCFFMGGDNSRT